MVHKHREILNNRNAIFSLCEASCELSLNRMWRHFSLDLPIVLRESIFPEAENTIFTTVKI